MLMRCIYWSQAGPPEALEQCVAMKEPKIREVMALSLTKIFRDGPLVSFSGSPTVSAVTAFLCAVEPLPFSGPKAPVCAAAEK